MEKRAYRMALIATSRHEDALDTVQDAMFTLAKSYADKTPEEWPALFHRILQNKIRDRYRHQSVISKIFFWRSTIQHDSDTYNEIDHLNIALDTSQQEPSSALQNQQMGNEIDQALKQLPLRQQQAFLLRAWEGMNVKQTAVIMQISEGSVKTHYSRAMAALRQSLQSFYSEE